MFTGIIEETGNIKVLSKEKDACLSARQAFRLVIMAGKSLQSVKKGESISVNGVCLTAVGIKNNYATFDITEQTFKNTSFRFLKTGNVVNIERSLGFNSRLEGHFVLGHVDRVARIKSMRKNNRPNIDVSISPEDRAYIVKKGSVAIDGISLTVSDVSKNSFRVYIIPHTLLNTNLGQKKTGDAVNIEFDILGKYILERPFNGKKSVSAVTEELLKNEGFI